MYSTYTDFFDGDFEKYRNKYIIANNGVIYNGDERLKNKTKVEIIGRKGDLLLINNLNSDGLYIIDEKGLKFL